MTNNLLTVVQGSSTSYDGKNANKSPLEDKTDSPQTEFMAQDYVTSRELDAKLEGIEGRMDRRVEDLARSVNAALSKIDEQTKHFDVAVGEVKATVAEVKEESQKTRLHSWGAAASVIATLLAVLALTNSWQQMTINNIQSTADKIAVNVSEIKNESQSQKTALAVLQVLMNKEISEK